MPVFRVVDTACHDVPASPLMICDRLIGLAQDAERAGYATTAGRLVRLATRIFDEKRASA